MLGGAGVPDLVEFLQVQPRGGRVVDIGDAVPGVGAHAVDDRAVIGDQIGGGALRRLRGDVADVDAARQPPPHGDEAVAVAHDAARLGEQHAHLGEAARQHEVLDDFEKGGLIVEIGLEVGGVDGDQALRGGGDLVDGGAHLGERGEHGERFGALAR